MFVFLKNEGETKPYIQNANYIRRIEPVLGRDDVVDVFFIDGTHSFVTADIYDLAQRLEVDFEVSNAPPYVAYLTGTDGSNGNCAIENLTLPVHADFDIGGGG